MSVYMNSVNDPPAGKPPKQRNCTNCRLQAVCIARYRVEAVPRFLQPDSKYFERRWLEDARICTEYLENDQMKTGETYSL